MRLRSRDLMVLSALALGSGAACADEPRTTEDPDIGLIEFLGSVDGLADLNPDYLSQGETAKPGKPSIPRATAPAPPPPPRQPPPPGASPAGGPSNE
jgi:hypothetical protein